MQGIYLGAARRPKTKKEFKEAWQEKPETVYIEATSVFGNEFSGRLIDAPVGTKIYFVGPDPYTKRMWYGSIEVKSDGKAVIK